MAKGGFIKEGKAKDGLVQKAPHSSLSKAGKAKGVSVKSMSCSK